MSKINNYWRAQVVGFVVGSLVLATSNHDVIAQDWRQVLDGAKREGKVVVAGPRGSHVLAAMQEFQSKFPDIQLEYSSVNSRNLGHESYRSVARGKNCGTFTSVEWEPYRAF